MEEVEATEEEVEDPPYASSIKQEIAPLVQIVDLNTRAVVVKAMAQALVSKAMAQVPAVAVVPEAMAQVADMEEVTKDTEVVADAEVIEVEVVLAVAVVVVVAVYASTTRKDLVHMVPTADLSTNRLFMKIIS